MAEFGWAYVGGGAVSSSGGPIGSIQFKTGTQSISGSQKLTFLTGSDSLYLTGTLFVSGTINANNYDVITTEYSLRIYGVSKVTLDVLFLLLKQIQEKQAFQKQFGSGS